LQAIAPTSGSTLLILLIRSLPPAAFISFSAHGGQPYLAPYVAAKAGLVGLTRNAAHAHRFDRIRINGLNIGWTETEGEDAIQRAFHGADDEWVSAAGARLPMGKLGQVLGDRRVRGIPSLRPQRSGYRLCDRLEPEGARLLRLNRSVHRSSPRMDLPPSHLLSY
jgi:NAD(P)-dependent dehydrogenase (short-subunit alcohol dehydrogenase family)